MKIFRLMLTVFAMNMCLSSCVKQSYDNPPDASQYDPLVPTNLTIAQLSNMAINMGVGQYRTMGDSTIYGIVTADDRTGNFYKQIVIQDSTGGITVSIAETNIYADYPIGRRVYIKLKGLILVNYKSLPQICLSVTNAAGTLTVTGMSSTLVNNYIVKGAIQNIVAPTKVRMSDLLGNSNHYLNMLVEIENMEFDASSAGMPLAVSPLIATSTSRTINDCPLTGSLVMYNSGYATWASILAPTGKGTITGIYSVYNSPQFLIRDTTDLKLTGNRDCQ